MNKTPVAVYARFSSHAQKEESIEQQLRACREYAEKNDMVIIKEYHDSALSGKTDKRPGFQKMILDSEKQKWEVLLVYSHDRFARNRFDAATYKNKLKKNGVRLVSVTLPLEDTPESVVIESFMEGFAEYYSRDLARKVTRGMEDNALKAKSNGGLTMGYKNENGHIVIDPVGAQAVQLIYNMYDQGKRKTEIIKELTDRGFKTKKGKAWSTTTLHKILTNERYTGVYIYNKTRIPDGMPRIIDQDLWERVQFRIKSYQYKGRKSMADFILSGKLFCGECGSRMTGESGKSHTGEVYYYYKCSKKKHQGKDACTKLTERKEPLEQAVLKYIYEEALTDENIKLIASEAFKLIDTEYQDKSLLNYFEAEYKEVTQKLQNILKAVEDGHYNAIMMDRLTSLEIEQQELEGRIVAEKLKKPPYTQDHIEYWLHSFKKGKIEDKDFANALVNSLINSVFIYDKKEDSDKKIVVALNLKNTPVKTLKGSNLQIMVDRHKDMTNRPLISHYIAVFVFNWA